MNALLLEVETGTAFVEISMEVPQKTRYRPTIYRHTTPGHITKGLFFSCYRDTFSSIFITLLFIIVRTGLNAH